MREPIFTGIGTALITPFKGGMIDYNALGRQLDFQLTGGVDAIVVCGTTGEASTMSYHERMRTIEYCVDHIAGRIPVIAGSGSNSTENAVALSRDASRSGADGLLVVTPYYNKATQPGLIRHYQVIADAVDIPLILYSVPSRTGVAIAPETYAALSRHPNILGTKEASGNFTTIQRTRALCPADFYIWSGNDDETVPICALGGKGVISVVSNVAPELVHNCCQAFFDGDTAKACALQLEMLPLEEALFCEVNPIPVKYAMNVLGWNAGECRLPLVEPSDAHKAKIEQALQAAGLIKE